MKEKELILTLSKYSNGGNSFLLFKFLLEKKSTEIFISQTILAKELNKTRPAIQNCLQLLQDIKLIECHYGKIKILGEKDNGN